MSKSIKKIISDNIDTRSALDALRDLVSHSNIYIRDNASKIDGLLLRRIATYVTDILHIFGAITGPRGGIGFPMKGAGDGSGNLEDIVMPYLTPLADFRNAIREHARSLKATEMLKLCDQLRDEILPNLGVRLEDREGKASFLSIHNSLLHFFFKANHQH